MLRNTLLIMLGAIVTLSIVFHESMLNWVNDRTQSMGKYFDQKRNEDNSGSIKYSQNEHGALRAREIGLSHGNARTQNVIATTTDSSIYPDRRTDVLGVKLNREGTVGLKSSINKIHRIEQIDSKIHIVKNYETLLSIANKYSLDSKELARWNSIPYNRLIKTNDTLLLHSDAVPRDNRKLLRHIVKKGETLSEIGMLYGVSVGTLKKVNGLPGNVIEAGKILIVDPWIYVKIKPGSTLSGIATQFKIPVSQITAINDIRNPDEIRSGRFVKVHIQ